MERIQVLSHEAAGAVVNPPLDVDDLRALIARATLYIGGDSGPLHIAATTHTPIVALFGPTLAERSMPWRDPRWFAESVDAGPLRCRPCKQRHCVPGDFRCLTRISPDRVVAAVERALTRRGPLRSAEETAGEVAGSLQASGKAGTLHA